MDDKEQIITIIKEWMIIDKELKQLQLALKERREKKKLLTDILVNKMNETNVDEYKTQSGKLIKTCQKNKKPITKSYLSTCIDKIFKSNPDEGKKVLQYIDENREIKIKENIRFK
tara:strand:- start:22 stop:366 length:345 start_codon:yes stop_codon:yes gene_type:complete